MAKGGIYEDLEVPSLGPAFNLTLARKEDENEGGIIKNVDENKPLPTNIAAKLKAYKIDWFPSYEAPEQMLLRRLEKYRTAMAPQAAANILQSLLSVPEAG